jgi:alpha-mannosidase
METRFAIRPYAGDFDPLAAGRFGEEQALPLLATALPANHPGEWKGASSSFVSVQSPTAFLTGLKRAERGDGYVVRVWESAGRRSPVVLSFPRHELLAAWRLTPVEGHLGRADLIDGAVRFELGPFELATFRCVIGR